MLSLLELAFTFILSLSLLSLLLPDSLGSLLDVGILDIDDTFFVDVILDVIDDDLLEYFLLDTLKIDLSEVSDVFI